MHYILYLVAVMETNEPLPQSMMIHAEPADQGLLVMNNDRKREMLLVSTSLSRQVPRTSAAAYSKACMGGS